MNSTEKLAKVDNILLRAAEEIGDITAPVLSAYYRRFPEGRRLFELHAYGDLENLEGRMVENALYCLMYWFSSRGEIEILLLDSIPHHSDTLKIPPSAYAAFLDVTAEVIEQTIPRENRDELLVWGELREDLAGIMEEGSKYILHTQS